MKKLNIALYAILALFFVACGTENKEEKKKTEETTEVVEKKEDIKITEKEKSKTESLKPISKEVLAKVKANFSSKVPFYLQFEGRTIFVTTNDKSKDYSEHFTGKIKYGIVNDSLQELLPTDFDKVFNPETTILNCIEYKKNGKVGLLNLKTKEVISPIFEYIFPAGKLISNLAYGFKSGKWHLINSDDMSNKEAADYNPFAEVGNLSFNMHMLGKSLMSYCDENDSYGPETGNGVLVVPSYLEYLKILPQKQYFDVLVDDNKAVDFGTTDIKLHKVKEVTVTDKVISFFTGAYESGIEARGYELEQNSLVVYNQETKKIESHVLHIQGMSSNNICGDSELKYVNDSIIEIQKALELFSEGDKLYGSETVYEYLKIDGNGKLTKLTTDRHFKSTKFIKMNEGHFKGCFADFMPNPQDDKNMWVSAHLTINDLDVMRNEIFAEYGYKFKKAKWNDYFSKKAWYKPQFDDVTSKLSDIDKANIELILKVKKKMEGREQEFVKKEAIMHVMAG